MNHKPITHYLVKGLSLFFIAALGSALAIGISPVGTAHAVIQPPIMDNTYANVTIHHSDLAIRRVSGPPKHAKACDVFGVTYTITNLGPDDLDNVNVLINVPDAFSVIHLQGVPVDLAVGHSATVKATIKVVAFVPGESRQAWVRAAVGSDDFGNTVIDPNSKNNEVFSAVKLISKPVRTCRP